jgi:hypothetical protein
MLARKYYAQRGTNRDTINKASIAPSSSSRLNNIKRNVCNTYKQYPLNTSSLHIKELRANAKKCESTGNDPDPQNNNGTKNGQCQTIHNMSTKTQGEYIHDYVYCPLDEELRKPTIKNNC